MYHKERRLSVSGRKPCKGEIRPHVGSEGVGIVRNEGGLTVANMFPPLLMKFVKHIFTIC